MNPSPFQSLKMLAGAALSMSVPVALCLLAAGCVAPVTGVVRLYDGLLNTSTLQEAESYCARRGEPFRLIPAQDAALAGQQGVLFRCD